MHELSICQSMLEIVDRTMAEHPGAKLLRIFLDVGKGSTIEPVLLSEAFDVITTDGPYEETKLVVNEIPLAGRCRSCGSTFEYQEVALGCPKCESVDIEITSGLELAIRELEIDENGAGDPPGGDAE
ncbi:MAG: hydrogenase maturation nickel metallochaperone HypA [Candidatus Eisenbacteria bacterium]|nr:hydrogenase maturation nickel metallochaperone HypA [Candidatus Eisenbacteria bacterium]